MRMCFNFAFTESILPAPMTALDQYLPAHMKHLKHSNLFSALETAIGPFIENKIVDARFVEKLIEIFAMEFDKAFDRQPINSRILELSYSSSIVNYRYDRGYWEVVVPQTTIMITDKSTGTTIFFRDSVDVSIEGSGGPLRKGKRKSESIKRAHSRQVAKDTRYAEPNSEGGDDEDFDGDEEWRP